jgi:pimeloyl-ACP methyl ester carboxylesterase
MMLGLVLSLPARGDALFQYTSQEVAIDLPDSGGVRLSGTLTVPVGQGPFPAVVLINGAGPQDRDATHAGHKPFAALADHLSGRGVAVLRTNDRGVGGSTGTLADATWLDLAADAGACVAFLLSHSKIDPGSIGVVGHSQGGIIAPIVAADYPDVGFLISLAGPSTDFIEFTLAQRRRAAVAQGAPEEAIAASESVLAAAFEAIVGARTLDEARDSVRKTLTAEALAQLGTTEAARDAIVGQLVTEENLVALNHNPQRVLPRVRVPVLALTGTLDSVIDANVNLEAIEVALADNPDVTTLALDGLNHFFQTAVTGDPSEYAELEEDFAVVALDAISDWINARFASR